MHGILLNQGHTDIFLFHPAGNQIADGASANDKNLVRRTAFKMKKIFDSRDIFFPRHKINLVARFYLVVTSGNNGLLFPRDCDNNPLELSEHGKRPADAGISLEQFIAEKNDLPVGKFGNFKGIRPGGELDDLIGHSQIRTDQEINSKRFFA